MIKETFQCIHILHSSATKKLQTNFEESGSNYPYEHEKLCQANQKSSAKLLQKSGQSLIYSNKIQRNLFWY